MDMKQFEAPEIWVQYFAAEDIVTASGWSDSSGDNSGAISGGAWEDELPR